ncbi:hypothetical protein BpHYR1_018862 [Brachionus plicatilis]|uniref:Uncharacterized protein n=1 Tax=Brachionus plicatilis TaxID=10195 RepID=A0A3M7PL87_BRAPC|nr:hypothetical protein BpHYR1_018862 [Brachionus plicatilis]
MTLRNTPSDEIYLFVFKFISVKKQKKTGAYLKLVLERNVVVIRLFYRILPKLSTNYEQLANSGTIPLDLSL